MCASLFFYLHLPAIVKIAILTIFDTLVHITQLLLDKDTLNVV